MIQVDICQKDIEIFKIERYRHPHPRVQQRMDVLWLKSNGLPHNQIVKLAGVCDNTVKEHLRIYKKGGIEKLKELNFYKPQSDLVQYTASIEHFFKDHPPASIKEAANKIEELTGLKRSETQTLSFSNLLASSVVKLARFPQRLI